MATKTKSKSHLGRNAAIAGGVLTAAAAGTAAALLLNKKTGKRNRAWVKRKANHALVVAKQDFEWLEKQAKKWASSLDHETRAELVARGKKLLAELERAPKTINRVVKKSAKVGRLEAKKAISKSKKRLKKS